MNTTKVSSSSEYFNGLTGLRAIAAYMVFIHHFNPFANSDNHLKLRYFVTELNVGVTLFFVLSGFLIGYRYYDLPKFDFKQYMVNRIARIYPMYFLLTTITFIALIVQNHESLGHQLKVFILNITFLRGYFQDYKFSGVSQGWSLTVEETFYLLAPLAFFIIKRNRIFGFLFPIILLIFGFTIVYIFKDLNAHSFMNSNQFMLRYTFLGRSYEFFIGIGLSLFYQKYKSTLNTKYVTLISSIFIFIFIFALSVLGKGYSGAGHPIGMVINTLLLPLFGFAPLFWGLIKENNFITRVLSSKSFVLLGKSSYIFYLIHIGVISAFLTPFTHSSIILFIILNVISILLFKTIEEPMNHYMRNKYKNFSRAK